MAKHISCDTTILLDPKTAPNEIDRVLNTMLYESRPVYIGVPVDVSHLEVDALGLKTPLKTILPPNDTTEENELVSQLRTLLEQKRNPIIIVDGNAIRGGVVNESRELAELTGLPCFTTCMGKGGPDESTPNFGGVYQGAGSYPDVAKAVEASDAVFWIGNVQTDFNTGEFTENVAEDITIDFQRFIVKVGKTQHNLKMLYVLRALVQSIKEKPLARSASKLTWEAYPENDPKPEAALTQDYLWPTLGKFFRPGDFIIGETGTSAFGLTAAILPKGATMYNQTVFGSIGYATGAALGALKAIREMGNIKRLILCTGEGSLHLTVQAFADFLKLELNPIIFVLNNDGYTVERLIHGRDAFYNQLPYWDYSKLAPAFGPRFPQAYHGPIDTPEKLDTLLADEGFAKADHFQLVELKLGYLDAPLSLRLAASAVEEFNKRKAGDGSMGV
ncbi:Pyruvate decarboxylase 1 [Oleoguttula sp. CCFEE 5521]